MDSLSHITKKWLFVILSVLLIASCKDESTEEQEESQQVVEVKQSIPFAYVERSVAAQAERYKNQFEQSLQNSGLSPLDLHSPYAFNTGARLMVRTGLEVDAIESEVLSEYFGSTDYDVKDLNVSADGKQLIFAARGSDANLKNFTWNIFIYSFDNKSIRRVIEDDAIANAGQDTNPVINNEGVIVFSSDRDAGDPAFPRENIELVGDLCEKVDPIENPSLLHRMTAQGENIVQLTFGTTNHDLNPTLLSDDKIAFVRWQRSMQPAPQCSANSGHSFEADFAAGLNSPGTWSDTNQCNLAKQTADGPVFVTNHYQLLTIDAQTKSMQQLYRTTTLDNSDAAFLALDKLLQIENGSLMTLIRHQYNSVLGGGVYELLPVQGEQNDNIFSEFSPRSLTSKNVDLYPEQLSLAGWFSTFWPYRDDSSRLLVSWAQCSIIDQGINRFCSASDSGAELDVQYGIWVYNPSDDSRLPVVRVKADTVFTELAISQPIVAQPSSLQVFDADFTDNEDGTEIVCHFPNNLPIANAGADQRGVAGNVYKLNGSESYDPDGDELTYAWTITEKPQGSAANLVNSDSVTPDLETDVGGVYRIQLVVNDGEADSTPDNVNVTVMVVNNVPKADAGADQTVNIGTLVKLSGANSSDADGDSLSYRWLILNAPAQSTAILSNSTTVEPEFTPDRVGSYQVQLIVNDGKVDSAPDTVNIIAGAPPVNNAPTANAGNDQSDDLGKTFTLNGSGSSDPDGDALTYRWSIQSKPTGSSASLFSANQVNASFTPDVEGDYVMQLIVNDGQVDSNIDTATISAVKNNTQPVANAGSDHQALTQETVVFDGSASLDADGDSLTYKWSMVSKPAGSNALLNNSESVKASLIADVAGSYTVQLIVNDGELDSVPDSAIATIEAKNQKPVANAGIDLTGAVGDTITLDGSRSSDPDGDPLTYRWTMTSSPAGSSVILNNADKVNPSFEPNLEGDYVAQLIVNDGSEDSDADRVNIKISIVNLRPVANAGEDQNASTGTQVTLDGSASNDPEGDPLTYRWTILQLPSGSSATLDNDESVSPTLMTDVKGNYEIQLIVNDGTSDSLPDSVTVSVEDPNNPPVADAGPDQPYKRNQTLQLDGSASSDRDGDPLTYRWSVVEPDVTDNIQLSNENDVTPNVIISDSQNYRLQLIVNDGKVDSAPDFVELKLDNTKPVADAGEDICDTVGVTIMLSGAGSSDLDGDPLTYQWRIVEAPIGSSSALSDSQIVNPSITFDTAGRYVIELVVSDGVVLSEPDTLVATIDEANTAPIANAGEDQSVHTGSKVTLDGSASRDPDGDPLSFRWSILHKPADSNAELSSSSSVQPKLDIDVAGDYVIQLIVNDGELDSEPDTVMISTFNMRPVANAGDDQSVDIMELVKLDGTGSYDSDGDDLTYRWSLLTVVGGTPPVIVNAESAEPEVTINETGTYVFQLIVNDGALDSVPDTVTIEVAPATCDLSDETQRVIPVTIRDFTPAHPDFEYHNMGTDYGIVKKDLGSDGLPVYARSYGSSKTTNGAAYFYQWYRDTDGVNLNIPKTLVITREPDSTIWGYSNSSFFPIDGEGYGNSGLTNPDHNYHFTMETHLSFDYKGGEVFTFRGDDDLWLFINGKLAIDIGGIHSAIERTIDLDEIADELGITVGNRYSFDLFFAERHTTRSNFKFQTNMDLECVE
ncbi:PKD domain-containing protein [Aliikangiella coralliicola]|uniref:Fibro-slime domain-containing protein n=1 Tax=Aliikangiella coralliicola TaxID=2592383 RepID=A0A545U019_9GAMM|nr:PKD domain-containing protein [Aliikangiella coralliicola]TQV82812.1 fibro-slime domain-containing protein [Aliikangiella coralliicola]